MKPFIMKVTLSKLAMFSFLIFLSNTTFAANTWIDGPVSITQLTHYSKEESIIPDYKGIVLVRFPSSTWTDGGNCNQTYAAVRGIDKHIIAAILSAKIANKPIKLSADDSLKLDSLCFLRAVMLP